LAINIKEVTTWRALSALSHIIMRRYRPHEEEAAACKIDNAINYKSISEDLKKALVFKLNIQIKI